jgi:flagellar biosynthesis/type III secretory pathway chaperone
MNEVLQSLHQFTDQLYGHIEAMRRLLEQEAEQLQNRDIESIAKTTREKEALVETTNALVKVQYQCLNVPDLDKKGGLEALFSALPSSSPETAGLKKRWQEIKRSTAQCNALNESNGAYIALFRQHVQRSLDVLHGQSSTSLVYGPDGIGHRQNSSRTLLSV